MPVTLTVPATRKTIRFEQEFMRELSMIDYDTEWTAINLLDLEDGPERDLLCTFINLVKPVDYPLNQSEILLTRSQNTMLKRIYGPCVFRKDDALVLKLGANEFPMHIEDREFVCSQVRGEVEMDHISQICYLRLRSEEPKLDWLVDMRLVEGVTASDIKETLRKNQSIVEFFQSSPTQGEGNPVLKMQDLGEGIFDVERIQEVKTKDGRKTFVIHLVDGRQCWSRGQVDMVLRQGPCPEGPLSIKIDNLSHKNGKIHLDCAFRRRDEVEQLKPTSDPQQEELLNETEQLMKRIPNGIEVGKAWASNRGYASRTLMPLELLQELKVYLTEQLAIEIPF